MESIQEFVLDACVCAKSDPYFLVDRLHGRSGFGYSYGYVDDIDINNMHEVISLGSGLMCNDA